jgi:hypothetical protein
VAKNDKKSRDRERRRKTWTVMVYMAAENSSELDAVAVEDLKEMERGVYDNVNDNVHIAVQINRVWPAVPQRYEIRSDRPTKRGVSELVDVDSDGTNMGDKGTFTRFLTWAAREFPADRYCLVLWGHAYGLGFGRDHGDALTLRELRDALQDFRDERQTHPKSRSRESDGRLDLLGANACAMSYVEAAYELREQADYMVASQIAVPYAGWPYELILSRIEPATDARGLGELVVNAYASHFNGLVAGERVTMSLLKLGVLSDLRESLDLKGVNDFRDLIQKFAVAIHEESRSSGPFGDRRAYVRDVFLAAASGDVRPLIDLEDLCVDFGDAESEDLRFMAEAIREFRRSLVIDHAGHPELVEELHGVGIFAPFVADEEDLKRLELQDEKRNGNGHKKTGRQAYEGLALFSAAKTAWPRLVYDELRQTAPSELLASLTGLGADSQEDRRDINQIVLAIESSFNKLDRVLREGRKRLDEELKAAKEREPSASRTGPVNTGAKRFGPPWLELIPPADLGAQVTTLKHLLTLKAIEQAASAPAGSGAARAVNVGSIAEPNIELFGSHPELFGSMRSVDATLEDAAVEFLVRVEKAVREVERATRKGLTHARLGLGPMAPDRFTFAEDPKTTNHGFAEDPKTTNHGFAEDPKTTNHGFIEDPKTTNHGVQGGGRDLRVDLAFARVVDLFGRAGQSLGQLEDATLQLESTARTTLSNAESQRLTRADTLKAAGQGIRRALAVAEEASKNARRTIRGVLSHPVYGLGPASDAIGLEEREALANAGGLSRRNLRLL